jgi:hypothetical protein
MSEIKPETVIASQGGYQPHPDSYSPRVLALVCNTGEFYEILRTGEAITWGKESPVDKLKADFWILDVPTIHSLGVHRNG